MDKKDLLNTKEVAHFLDINEKMVYTLINEKGLPATKITGKWLFPKHLVEQWLETETINYPEAIIPLPPYHGLLIICGSNDVLLENTVSYYNSLHSDHVAVFGNMGSLGGIRALGNGLCHMASSHLMQEDEKEYNFGFAKEELDQVPAVVNFCMREQGIIIQKGNPKEIKNIWDLGKPDVKIVNRSRGTGTRLLFDGEILKSGLKSDDLIGYDVEVQRHMDIGLNILSGKADAGPGIRAVAEQLDLDFIPLKWERFDLIIPKDRFFEKGVQLFLGILRRQDFQNIMDDLEGYNVDRSGEVVFPMSA